LKFNTKKKTKEEAHVEILFKNTNAPDAELDEKDLHFGMFILGTEKHDSRRIDNQLRGRAGRQ
jgi:preprotein translocase subunit SecA